MNNITLIGRTTNDIEIKTTQSGHMVAAFSLAVKRPYKKDETDFFNIIAWDKKAELLKQYVNKGNMVGISGYVQIRPYEKDGQKRYITEVITEKIDLIGGTTSAAQEDSTTANNVFTTSEVFDGIPVPSDDDLPF